VDISLAKGMPQGAVWNLQGIENVVVVVLKFYLAICTGRIAFLLVKAPNSPACVGDTTGA
jgi:hypothetical protein